jgi:DNA-binding transcriptional MerR regulator
MKKKAIAPKLMTISDAEKKTGMSRQTLTNWMDSGLLPGMRTSRSIWISTEAINKLLDTTVPANNIRKEVEKLNEQYTAQKAELEKKIAEINSWIKVINSSLEDCALSTVQREIVDRILYIFGEKMNERERFIMDQFMNGKTVQELSETLGLSPDRLWNVYHRGMEKLDKSSSIFEENEWLKEENERLMTEHIIMKDAYINVRNKNTELEDSLQSYRILHENVAPFNGEPLSEEESHMIALLRTKLEDCNISKRVLNVLKKAEIETIGDLVSYNMSDILRFRDMGRKSLNELDELVETLNLSFGMDVQKYLLREADSYTA